jgi:hypothetical protein
MEGHTQKIPIVEHRETPEQVRGTPVEHPWNVVEHEKSFVEHCGTKNSC